MLLSGVKRVKNTHLPTDEHTQTYIPTATRLSAFQPSLPAWYLLQKPCCQQMVFQPGSSSFVISQLRVMGSISWAGSTLEDGGMGKLRGGNGAGGKRKTPEEALIEFLAVQHSSASPLLRDYAPQTLIACQKTLFISSARQFQFTFKGLGSGDGSHLSIACCILSFQVS